MNLTQNRLSHIVLGLAVLGAVVLNCILLSRVGRGIYWALIAITVVLPPLAIGAALFLRRLKTIQPPSQLKSTPPSIQFWVVTVAIGCALAVGGVFSGHLWLMMIGQLFAPIAASLRGQFSLRRIFGIMTLLAICMGMVSAIERRRDKTNREREHQRIEANKVIEQNGIRAIRKLTMDSIAKRRAILESRKDRLSPDYYEKRTKALDEEEAKLKQESIDAS
jgi:hypothetical protein